MPYSVVMIIQRRHPFVTALLGGPAVAQIEYPEIEEGSKPRHRVMSAYEQRKEPWSKDWQYLLFAAEPYVRAAPLLHAVCLSFATLLRQSAGLWLLTMAPSGDHCFQNPKPGGGEASREAVHALVGMGVGRCFFSKGQGLLPCRAVAAVRTGIVTIT